MSKLTDTCSVWVSNPGTGLDYFRNPDFEFASFSFVVSEVDFSPYGYFKIADAEIRLTNVVDEVQLLSCSVEYLRAKQAEARAEAEKKAMEIEEQINRLLAIEFKSEKVAVPATHPTDDEAEDDIPF